jgi:ORMDL family
VLDTVRNSNVSRFISHHLCLGRTSPMKQPRPTTSATNGSGHSTLSAAQPQRSLHSPIPRSRLNSKEILSSAAGGEISHADIVSVASAMTDGTSQHNLPVLPPPPESPSGRTTAHRTRFNSRDIPRSYSGQYSTESNNLLPLEFNRSQNIVTRNVSLVVFLSTYLTFVFILQFASVSIVSSTASDKGTKPWSKHLHIILSSSWTVTHAVHCLVTLLYLHWLKGSYLLDEQGELNAMTVWEQLEATSESSTHMRRILLIVPTCLAYMACLSSKFQPSTCTINIIFWSISMFAKLPQMNGVRLFGINRTAGIDDDFGFHDCTAADDGSDHMAAKSLSDHRPLISGHLNMPILDSKTIRSDFLQ